MNAIADADPIEAPAESARVQSRVGENPGMRGQRPTGAVGGKSGVAVPAFGALGWETTLSRRPKVKKNPEARGIWLPESGRCPTGGTVKCVDVVRIPLSGFLKIKK